MKKFCQGLLTPLPPGLADVKKFFVKNFTKFFSMAGPGGLTWGAGCGLLYALNREAHAVELQIIMIILVLLATGIAGGIILAYAWDLDAPARRRRQRQAKRKARRL